MNDFRPRIWPALIIVAVTAACVGMAPFFAPRTMLHFVAVIGGPILGTLGILIWWFIGSRARGSNRWLPIAAFVLPAILMYVMLYRGDELKIVAYFAPAVALVWVIALLVTPTLRWSTRGIVLLAAIIGGWMTAAMLRIDGMDAEMIPSLRWAWDPSAKELLDLEVRNLRTAVVTTQPTNTQVVIEPGDWPEFRGPKRDDIAVGGMRTDWKANPPKEVWRHRVGAGWGSFAIVGDRAFTQEQRGNDECIVCYHAGTGQQLWEYRVPGRFFESIAGEGPRGTPTIHDGKCYAFTAFGKLAALDAATGKQLWLRDVIPDVGATVPQWGFASSPLVIAGNVLVFTAAQEKAVAAYACADGKLAWARGQGQHGYSSPQRFEFEGTDYVLMVSDYGLEAFDPKTGEPRGEFAWTIRGQNRVAQPTIITPKSILLGTAVGSAQGAKRLAVAKAGDKLTFTPVWEGKSPKPYFNDGVVFENHYYGFDDRNFVCVDLKSGKVKWNAGSNTGFGQVLLVPEQKMLIVQAESGGVLLVPADPDDYGIAAKLPVFEDKTWNHPVLVRGKLYFRNGVEAVCYDVSLPK